MMAKGDDVMGNGSGTRRAYTWSNIEWHIYDVHSVGYAI